MLVQEERGVPDHVHLDLLVSVGFLRHALGRCHIIPIAPMGVLTPYDAKQPDGLYGKIEQGLEPDLGSPSGAFLMALRCRCWHLRTTASPSV